MLYKDLMDKLMLGQDLTRAELERCKAAAGDAWDEDEIYFVAQELREAFPQLKFRPISSCAGLLTIQK